MHDERPGERLLVLRIRQHLEEEADQALGKLVLHSPEHQLLEESLVGQLLSQNGDVCNGKCANRLLFQ